MQVPQVNAGLNVVCPSSRLRQEGKRLSFLALLSQYFSAELVQTSPGISG